MKKTLSTIILSIFLITGCATDPYTGESKVSSTSKGAGIGALAGAGIGALIGGEKGALIGAGIGAASGAGVGGYMDIQAKQLRQELQGTGVQVVEDGGRIYLIMPGNITFNTNEAIIKESFKPVLDSVAKVLNNYDKTLVQVTGYTDNTGSDKTNDALSLKRANSVSTYLTIRNVAQNRLVSSGMGSKNPIASNATPEGREQNRRVEIVLINQQ